MQQWQMAQSEHSDRLVLAIRSTYICRGLVIMGSGAAQLSPSAITAAADLFKKGIPTVAVARPVTGTGSPAVTPGAT